jgi:hypothetical protein
MMGYVGPAGPTTSIHAPFGYGQDEDKYEGPTFPHVPTVVRPVTLAPTHPLRLPTSPRPAQVPLGGVDQYHVASDPPISTKCTLKEKYEPCSVDHVSAAPCTPQSSTGCPHRLFTTLEPPLELIDA